MRAKDRMIKDPVVATVPGARRDLLKIFLEHGHAAMPVVKEGTRHLAGIVTRRDLLDHPDEAQTALLMDPNPATTYIEAPLREAGRILVERRLRILPVVAGTNELVGVLSPRELLPAFPAGRNHVAARERRPFVPVHRATPAIVAVEIMRSTNAGALPVVDDLGRYIGLMEEGELLRHLRLDDVLVRTTAGLAGEGDAWSWGSTAATRKQTHATTRLGVPDGTVEGMMKRDAPTLSSTTTLREAVHLFLGHRLHHAAVLEPDERVRDVVSELDLVEALIA